MICFGEVPTGSVLPIPFASYAGSTGASVTLTGLAVTDIEVYKGTSMTQRSSDSGYALMDTDGIDIDGVAGIHGFSIDTGDNSDSGFYAVGAFCWVVVSAVTIDGQTVNFIAATFRIVEGETVAGRKEARVASIAAGAIDATAIAADAIGSSELAASAVNKIGDAILSDSTPFAGASIAAIKAKTDNLPSDPADQSLIIAATDAITTQISALNNISQAQVKTQVVDALSVDTYAEPGQGAPGATISLAAKIGYLYKAWRNEKRQTASLHSLMNDDGSTVGQKSTVSDDGTTAIRGEMATGA